MAETLLLADETLMKRRMAKKESSIPKLSIINIDFNCSCGEYCSNKIKHRVYYTSTYIKNLFEFKKRSRDFVMLKKTTKIRVT